MNLIQVNCFIAVVEEQNYTRAAELLYLSQPTLSKYVMALEKELDCKLFHRTTRKIQLTDEGELYYQMFARWKKELSELKMKTQRDRQEPRLDLSMGIIEGWYSNDLFVEIYSTIKKIYPSIELKVICHGLGESVKKLSSGEVDVVITVDDFNINESRFEKRRLTEVDKVILYSKAHRLAGKDNLKPQDFKNEIFYSLPDKDVPFADTFIRSCCSKYGFVPIIEHLPNLQTVYANIKFGQGVMLYDKFEKSHMDDDFLMLPLEIKGGLFAVWDKENTNPALRDIEKLIKEDLF